MGDGRRSRDREISACCMSSGRWTLWRVTQSRGAEKSFLSGRYRVGFYAVRSLLTNSDNYSDKNNVIGQNCRED